MKRKIILIASHIGIATMVKKSGLDATIIEPAKLHRSDPEPLIIKEVPRTLVSIKESKPKYKNRNRHFYRKNK